MEPLFVENRFGRMGEWGFGRVVARHGAELLAGGSGQQAWGPLRVAALSPHYWSITLAKGCRGLAECKGARVMG